MTKPLNAFTAPATVRFARHEHAQITRDTAPSRKSIHITPPAGTKADREALRAPYFPILGRGTDTLYMDRWWVFKAMARQRRAEPRRRAGGGCRAFFVCTTSACLTTATMSTPPGTRAR